MKISFEETVKAYSDMVYRVAFNILADTEDSKDCMQNVFLRFYKHQDSFKEEKHIKAWLIRVAINESKRILKLNSRKSEVSLDEIANKVFKEDTESKDLFKEVMKLDKKYRTVVFLYYYEGYSLKEIADILRRNPATVRTQLSRARELLKNQLKED